MQYLFSLESVKENKEEKVNLSVTKDLSINDGTNLLNLLQEILLFSIDKFTNTVETNRTQSILLAQIMEIYSPQFHSN